MFIVSIDVAVEVAFVNSVMCSVGITQGSKTIGSAVLKALPGSSYVKKEKRWLIPLLCLPELTERREWECSVDDDVECAYREQVKKMVANLRMIGVRVGMKNKSPNLGTEKLEEHMKAPIIALVKKHRDAVVDFLEVEEWKRTSQI